MKTKILFITWDGPKTSYMEGLFMPILSKIQDIGYFEIHVIQFTWGTKERNEIVEKKAKALNIKYTGKNIYRKPIATIGSVITLYKGIKFLRKYISKNQINVVMPRSTMPAIMVNRLNKRTFKIVFDADGLPLEERVDFSGLIKSSKQYKFLKKEESKMLLDADAIITRSKKAISIHKKTIPNSNPEKFSVVLNGRDPEFFKPNDLVREQIRAELNIQNDTKVFVYCGSLGPQYCWDEMMAIFIRYQQNHHNSKFLILTSNIEFALKRILDPIKQNIIIKKLPFEEVPKYLSGADIAFAVRQPKFSMLGVAPIKLGEYLLMGLPTIASAGIGDTEEILKKIPNCFLFDNNSSESIERAVTFFEGIKEVDKEAIRNYGIEYFSIENSANSYIKALDRLK